MTKIILPSMVKKSKGVLLFLSSATSIVPCPYFSIYSATKVNLKSITEKFDFFYPQPRLIEPYPETIKAQYHSITKSEVRA